MLLRSFLTQIKTELSRRLNIWRTESFDKALASAIRYEEDSAHIKREKNEKLTNYAEQSKEYFQKPNLSTNRTKLMREQPVKKILHELVALLKESSNSTAKNEQYRKKLDLRQTNR